MSEKIEDVKKRLLTYQYMVENQSYYSKSKLAQAYKYLSGFSDAMSILANDAADAQEPCALGSVVGRSEQLKPSHCPSCNRYWDTDKYNSCECGASIKRF